MIVIDDSALVNNARYFRQLVGRSKICAVVKCNAYSHGIVHCATVIADIVDFFAVSSVSEARSIEFLHKDILILLPLDSTDMLDSRARYQLTVDSIETATRLVSVSNQSNLKFDVHIKVDSGMSRLGVNVEQLPTVIALLQGVANIVGLYSHFSCSDSDDEYSSQQFEYFSACCDIAQQQLHYMPIRHICNTMGTIKYSKYHLDMVRIGLGLYGYGHSSLVPAKSVYGRVIATKHISKGSAVSYNNTYIAQRDTNIAIVDIGYYNGLCQCNGALVAVDNEQFPIIGKTCMGMIIVDTYNTLLTLFDKVTIIGNNTTVQYSGVSIYELLCNCKDN